MGNGVKHFTEQLFHQLFQGNIVYSFSLFALPNPDDPSPNNLVPILIGMDHIGTSGCQMLVDFSLGYVIDGVDPQADLYQLKTNSKGHFVYDVVYHLTRGKSNQQGSAHVHVDRSFGHWNFIILKLNAKHQ